MITALSSTYHIMFFVLSFFGSMREMSTDKERETRKDLLFFLHKVWIYNVRTHVRLPTYSWTRFVGCEAPPDPRRDEEGPPPSRDDEEEEVGEVTLSDGLASLVPLVVPLPFSCLVDVVRTSSYKSTPSPVGSSFSCDVGKREKKATQNDVYDSRLMVYSHHQQQL